MDDAFWNIFYTDNELADTIFLKWTRDKYQERSLFA